MTAFVKSPRFPAWLVVLCAFQMHDYFWLTPSVNKLPSSNWSLLQTLRVRSGSPCYFDGGQSMAPIGLPPVPWDGAERALCSKSQYGQKDIETHIGTDIRMRSETKHTGTAFAQCLVRSSTMLCLVGSFLFLGSGRGANCAVNRP